MNREEHTRGRTRAHEFGFLCHTAAAECACSPSQSMSLSSKFSSGCSNCQSDHLFALFFTGPYGGVDRAGVSFRMLSLQWKTIKRL